MRIPMVVGNWKMNTTLNESIKLVSDILPEIEDTQSIDRVICPPFISLSTVSRQLEKSSVKLGAQNLFFEEKGAFTGEISPLMLSSLCQFVIIGHSERRQYFNETNAIVNKKMKAAMKVGLKPILCVGENIKENEDGRAEEVVTCQLTEAISGISELNDIVIAYEPVWAIGSGLAANGPQANSIASLVRRILTRCFSEEKARKIRILYGGSVSADNIAEFVSQPEIDGALVGGASLKPIQFIKIVRQTAQIKILKN
mgnify:CR=1 FL=1